MIKSVHNYAYKSGGTQGGGRKMTRIGCSNELDGVVSRFMPYKLKLMKSDKSKLPKTRNQEEIRRIIKTSC